MINEHEMVVLNEDLSEEGLKKGDIGRVVHVHAQGIGYEVEFNSGDGQPVAIVGLRPDQVRLMSSKEILHARPIAA